MGSFKNISDQDFGKLLKHAIEGEGCSSCSTILMSLLGGDVEAARAKIKKVLNEQDTKHASVRITLIHIFKSEELANAH